jgi:hypothetical protein
MARKRKRASAEELAENEARAKRTLAMLQERIDFHDARLRQRHGAGYRPATLEERLAYYEARRRP